MILYLLFICLASSQANKIDPRCPAYFDDSVTFNLPDEKDCNKFHVCIGDGSTVMKSCVKGTYFDPIEQVCTTDDSVCKPVMPPQDINVCEGKEFGETTAVPNDCSSYYICLGDENVKLECTEGLLYDYLNNVCDFPDKVTCLTNKPQKPTTQRPNPTPKPTNKPTDPSINDPRCANVEAEELVTFSHPNDCNKYYTCVHGKALLRACPINHHWNNVQMWCDYPEMAGCQNGGYPTQPTLRPTMAPTRPTTTYAPTQRPTQPNNEIVYDPRCPSQSNNNQNTIFLNDYYDCGKYYVCAYGFAFVRYCPANQHWNVQKSYCDWPELAGCQNYT